MKPTKVILEYVWLGGNQELRSKTKVLQTSWISESITDQDFPLTIEQIPVWNYDGSSTGQATTSVSEVLLRPQRLFKDPFRKALPEPAFLVLCDTYLPDGTPHVTNTRYPASKIFEHADQLNLEPLFGLEQEFFIYDPTTGRPIGFPTELEALPEKQGKYYCSVGTGKAFGRKAMEEVLKYCLYAEISLTGMNFEVAPGQFEFQICDYGISAADHLIMFRYILERTLEDYNLKVDLRPKPLKGDWNGSGCHTNFSTSPMRYGTSGLDIIKVAIEKLGYKHHEHIAVYGEGNHERLTGAHETSSMETFSYGVGNRGASIRIPNETMKNECGYFEDRRPASSIDPYVVTAKILETTSLS